MSDRMPATDRGTTDRIEADDGGYWVRLVTKQALKREGECMGNCLARGAHGEAAGDEEMVSNAIWSLRKADGVSYMTVEVDADYGPMIDQAEGPMKSQPSAWSCRQLRHLVTAFRDAGATLSLPEKIALTGADGRTWRPDKAPQDLQDALAARQRQEHEEATERARGRGDTHFFIRNDPFVRSAFQSIQRGIVGDGPVAIAGVDTQNGNVCIRLSDGSIREAALPRFERLEIRTDENPLRPILEPIFQPPRAPEPRLGVTSFPEVTGWMFQQITDGSEPVHAIEVAAATAGGTDLVAEQDYIVDERMGLVTFCDVMSDVEVLWREKACHPSVQMTPMSFNRLAAILALMAGPSGPGPGEGARP